LLKSVGIFTGRRFTHVFPPGLALEVLNISRLGLVSLDPVGLFENLASTLVVVDASNNQLFHVAPTTFLPLTGLKTALLVGKKIAKILVNSAHY
jgi:hypothetical protein